MLVAPNWQRVEEQQHGGRVAWRHLAAEGCGEFYLGHRWRVQRLRASEKIQMFL